MENKVCQVLLQARPETQSDPASPGSCSSLPVTSPPPFLTQQDRGLEPCPTSGTHQPLSLLLLVNKVHTHGAMASV